MNKNHLCKLKKIETIYKNFKIKKYKEKSKEFYESIDPYDNTMNKILSCDTLLVGGGKDDFIVIDYEGKKFNFEKQNGKEEVSFSLKSKKSNIECIIIFINKKYEYASIHSIFYDEGCIYSDMKNEYKSGGTIIKLALKLIDKVKEKYNLKYVRLQDNSYKTCYNIKGNSINLSRMMTLMTGETWYGKYGFRPFDAHDENNTGNLFKKYLKNKEIMEKAKMKDIKNFKILIKNGLDKSNYDKKMEIDIIELFDDYYSKNILVKDFLSTLLKPKFFNGNDKIKGTCLLFYYIYMDLYEELRLYDFASKSFIKVLQ
jgi:hypothetical protein